MGERRRFAKVMPQVQLAMEDVAVGERDTALAERDAALAERDAALAARDAAVSEIAFLKNTRSWRLTRPLRYIARLIRYGIGREDWNRISRIVPFRIKSRSMPGRIETTSREPLEHPAPQPLTMAAPAAEPAPATIGNPDIVCFANIDWSARFQRPQQLMRQFAENGFRIFYVVASRASPGGQLYSIEEVSPGIYEVVLQTEAFQDIYAERLSDDNLCAYSRSIDALSRDFRIKTAISVIHLSYWTPLGRHLRLRRGWRIQYDCMDDWVDFPHIGDALLEEEKALVAGADLVTVTASSLHEKWSEHAARCVLVRNAVDFSFFARHCIPNALLQDIGRPVIGFYGGLAEWVDLHLIAQIAERRPDWNIVLIGDVFIKDLDGLDQRNNVHLLGKKPYAEMPLYLYGFDVCLIPFRLYHVTHAVDPVKFYEFMSAGKPVVSVPLEEMGIYEDFVYFATGPDEFVEKIAMALNESDLELARKRVELARANDWRNRFEDTRRALFDLYPKVSIIVVSYNNVELTRLCMDSIFRNTTYPNYEVIVVDNASEDDTRNYLRYLRRSKESISIILNDRNLGFAAANNQGLRLASGTFLVLLNNDTVVPKGWVDGLLRHLEDPGIGMVGPVTNFVGNEARIATSYEDMEQMETFSDGYTAARHGRIFDISMLAMFCVALRRDVFERVGFLDETFGLGMFEDDDYSRRVQDAGLRTVCAEDVFVHHFGQASFRKLIANGEYQKLWDRNQAYFENKWGAWKPHMHRQLH